MLNPTYRMTSKYPPLFRIKKENMQVSCQPMDKGHTTKPVVMRTIAPVSNRKKTNFEDLTILNRSLKAQILVISETKIDRSYPDSQFKLQGYNMFCMDRAKGGGGLLVYIYQQQFHQESSLSRQLIKH